MQVGPTKVSNRLKACADHFVEFFASLAYLRLTYLLKQKHG